MAAEISATGTFTDMSTVLNAARSNKIGNEPRLEGAIGTAPGGTGINLDALKTMETIEFPEVTQFINLVAQAYGLLFWPAAHLVYITLKGFIQGKSDTVLGDSNGARVYP